MTSKSADLTATHMSDTSSMYRDDVCSCVDASTVIPQRCQHSRTRSNVTSVAYEYDDCLNHTTSTSQEDVGSKAPQRETNAEADERRRRSAAIARAEAKFMAWVEADAHTADRQSKWPDIDPLNDEHLFPELGVGAAGAVGSRPPTPPRHPMRPSSTTAKSSETTRGTTETERGASLRSRRSQLPRQSPATLVVGSVPRCIEHSLHFRTKTGELLARPVEEGSEGSEGQNLSVLQNDGCPPQSHASAASVIQHSPPFGSSRQFHVRGSAGANYTMPTLSRYQTCSSRTTKYPTPPRSTGGVESSMGNVYDLGDHSLGYSSGLFVTNISSVQSSNKAPRKSSMRRISCLGARQK
ncbi:hypothetical protein BKA63DRAFT_491481 [Paraphoma chrysanthemicola]|nr:hypothetical protein BKA63DRAFT_491481 [Paraphoma chrysanthemicola]